ncbi:TonB-dependent receptor domain-containing protein, partial [Klebsiella pneumoniae]|uniref:TonB-dependent receptor domain-containing protein n=1 Tax=Klebsiella pneumoniae TaxID=573 RepID=UPI0013D56D1D
PYNDRVLSQQQVGLYVQDQMKLDRWTLVVSGRNDWVDTDLTNRNATPNASRDVSKATGRAGLIYAGDYGLSPYVSYATSFN